MSAPANAMSLLDLPPDVLGGVVFVWLDTKSIVRLDSSVCCNTHRPTFLAFLRSKHAILRELPAAELSKAARKNALCWATVRQVRCHILKITAGVDAEILEKYCRSAQPPANTQLVDRQNTQCISLVIAAHCRALRHIYFLRCTLCSFVCSIYVCCSSLREIFLYSSVVVVEHFATSKCPNIITLAMRKCNIDDHCMIAAVAMCPNVVNLDIGNNNLTDQAVRDTVTKRPQLKRLSIHNLNVSDETIVAIAVTCTLLHGIDLGSCTALTDVAVIALATNCKQLTHIQLFNNFNYTRESLRAISFHCSGLKQCVFHNFIDASHEDEVLLFHSCRHLERVEMRFSSPVSVASIPPSVTQLALYVSNTTDTMLLAIAKHCSNLTKLSIAHGSPDDRLYTVKGLAAIAGGCRKLRKLVLQGDTEQIPEMALLVWRNTCPQLQVVGSLDWWTYYLFSPMEAM